MTFLRLTSWRARRAVLAWAWVTITVAACTTSPPPPASVDPAGILLIEVGERVQGGPPTEELKIALSNALVLAENHGVDLGYPTFDATTGELVLSVVTPNGRSLIEDAGITAPYRLRSVAHGVGHLPELVRCTDQGGVDQLAASRSDHGRDDLPGRRVEPRVSDVVAMVVGHDQQVAHHDLEVFGGRTDLDLLARLDDEDPWRRYAHRRGGGIRAGGHDQGEQADHSHRAHRGMVIRGAAAKDERGCARADMVGR